MSASPIARQVTQSQVIPQSRKVIINDENQLPLDYSTTPGGTLFSTTPGGTRIVYERRFLMQMKTSPLAQTPPKNLPYIRGVTKSEEVAGDQRLHSPATSPPKIDKIDEEETVNPDHEPQFEMEI